MLFLPMFRCHKVSHCSVSLIVWFLFCNTLWFHQTAARKWHRNVDLLRCAPSMAGKFIRFQGPHCFARGGGQRWRGWGLPTHGVGGRREHQGPQRVGWLDEVVGWNKTVWFSRISLAISVELSSSWRLFFDVHWTWWPDVAPPNGEP